MKRIYLAIPEGKKVHNAFWQAAARMHIMMTSIFVKSYHAAETNLDTNTRKGKLPMQVNPN